jgi:hypothetical protein
VAAHTQFSQPPIPELAPEEVQETLDRVLHSKHFVNAPKKQKFLRLISEFYLRGRGKELNEYLIGREVFERDDSYNPAADPIVRVGAHEIRKKLELYYQHEGATDPIRLEIPVGSYEAAFIRLAPPPLRLTTPLAPAPPEERALIFPETPAPSSEMVNPSPVKQLWQPWQLWQRPPIILLTVFATILIGALLIYIFQLRSELQKMEDGRETVAGPLWGMFFENSDPTMLVLSSPPVLRLSNAGDPEVILRKSIELSPEQTVQLAETMPDVFAIRNRGPVSRLIFTPTNYTGLGEAIAAQRLTDLFRAGGRSVQLKRSRTLSAEDLRKHHIILLGSVWANEWSGKLSVEEDFVHTAQATIENRRPLPGEEKIYRSRFDEQTGALLEDYALITVRPNISEEHRTLILAGLRSAGTEAAAEFVTGKTSRQEIDRRLAELGRPWHFQMLLKVGVENGIPTTITLLAIHEIKR